MKFNLRHLFVFVAIAAVTMALFVYLRHELAHGERTIGRFDLNDGSDIRIFVDTSLDSLGGTYWTRENSTGNDFPKQYLTNSRQSRIR